MSMISTRSILEAAAAGRTTEALAEANALLRDHPDCPYLLVLHAVLIQVQDPALALATAMKPDGNYSPAPTVLDG